MSRASRARIGDRHAAHFGVVFRRHDDVEGGGQAAVASDEFGAILGEHDVVAVGLRAARLVGGGPHLAALDIAQEDVAAPVVARRVLAPARDGPIAPAAVARAGGRQHHRVAAVGQQVRRTGWRRAECAGGARTAARDRRRGAGAALPRPADGRPRRRAACAPAAAARSPA